MIFDSSGQLVVGRDVLIHDLDTEGDGLGDRTRLGVDDPARWWDGKAINRSVLGSLFDIVILDDGAAANFVSVDGLLVYDDSSLDGFENDVNEMQAVMQRDGQSLFVSRYTGEVIFGPKGG